MATHSAFWLFMSTVMGSLSIVFDCVWFLAHQITWSVLHAVAPYFFVGPTKAWVPSTRGPECVVLVTGTSAGIGREIALGLGRVGYTVFAGVRKEEDGQTLVKQHEKEMLSISRSSGGAQALGSIRPVVLEPISQKSIDSVYEKIEEHLNNEQEHSVFAGIINSAGIVPITPLEHISEEGAHNVFDVNFFGLLSLTQRMLPLLRCYSGSRIIFIGSVAAWLPFPGMGLYCASKAAIRAVASILDEEIKALGHRVLLIEPGVIHTRSSHEKSHEKTLGNTLTRSSERPSLPRDREKAAAKHYEYVLQYCEHMAGIVRRVFQPSSVVVYDVVHALQSPRPLNTYYAGLDAKTAALVARVWPESLTVLGAATRLPESFEC